jgi:hypothetical protein
MYKFKQVWHITAENFVGWRKSPRIFMTFILAFVLCLMLSNQAISFSQQYGTYMQVLEPFIWTFGDANSVMLSSLLLILLFADMPFITEATPYWLIRVSRRVWLLGQVLYVLLATFVYTAFLLIVECILAAPRSFAGNVWSDTGAMIGYSGIGSEIALPASLKTMEMSTPYRCAATVFLLVLIYSLFIAAILLFFNVWKSKAVGVMGAFAVNLYGFFLNPEIFQRIFSFSSYYEYRANLLTGWLSPLNHATYYMHNFGYDYLPRIGMSLGIFAVLIFLLLFGAERKMKTYDFSFIQTDA